MSPSNATSAVLTRMARTEAKTERIQPINPFRRLFNSMEIFALRVAANKPQSDKFLSCGTASVGCRTKGIDKKNQVDTISSSINNTLGKSMATLKDLLAQREALEAKIEELRAAELSQAIGKVRALIDEFGLTQQDIFPSKSGGKTRKAATAKVPAKYRDPVTGALWSGRGVAPRWVAGKNKADFLIA